MNARIFQLLSIQSGVVLPLTTTVHRRERRFPVWSCDGELDVPVSGVNVSRMPDQHLPQPPPVEPPAGEPERLSRWKMRLLFGIGVLSAAAIIGLANPKVVRSQRKSEIPEAVSHAHALGLALIEFENEYGSYPDRLTAADVRRKTGSSLTLGDRTSNDLFAQLLIADFANKEAIFYTAAKSAVKPDEDFITDATILKHGECTFAFISGLSAAGDPIRPLVFGPVIPGTTTLDRDAFGGKAVILRIDNSVDALPIDASGRMIDHGMDMLDLRQPYWHGKAPDVKWPK